MSLPHWVDFFDDLKNIRGRSQNTVLAYQRDLELFSLFLKKYKKLDSIYQFMTKNELSTRSQARMISSMGIRRIKGVFYEIEKYLMYFSPFFSDLFDFRKSRKSIFSLFR